MSGDFDPRDRDSRERDDGIHDREDEWLTLGRGPGSAAVRDGSPEDDVRDRDDDWREARDRESSDRDDDRGIDPRDVFMRDLDLPRGPERELVHDRDRDYTLNGSESRTLSTVGAFRVVSERDLRDPREDAFDLRHLEDQGLKRGQLGQSFDRDDDRTNGQRGTGHAIGHPDRNRRRALIMRAEPDLATIPHAALHDKRLAVQRMPRIVDRDLLGVVGRM